MALYIFLYSNGEYHFRLVDAQGLRQDLVKLYEVVDSMRYIYLLLINAHY